MSTKLLKMHWYWPWFKLVVYSVPVEAVPASKNVSWIVRLLIT